MQPDIPVLVNHVTLWMPVLVLAIAEDFDKLLQNGCLAAVAALGKFCRIVIMAVDVSFVLVIAVLGAKHGRAYGAGEMLDVILSIQCGDVRAAKSASACMAEQV